ncbi:formyltransferase family protein [Aquirufa aurantiipilula]|uniref:formyltransferase family protein n=1 Tax=Aquirufa aurantiipilula TaxID=2696561 RepID=UPI001CAA6B5A|nr:formyltransferase family protein [Aquirufa aurantiipilula]MBZ1326601.1 methionyl-tRNA formyltransferase [Aquirufa aurantiipilula]
MRIIFIGSVYFSKVMLEKLIELNALVVGVITKEKSSFNADFEDLSSIAIRNRIPFNYVQNINESSSIEWIKNLNADIIFCFGWSNLIKKDVLTTCPLGVIGFHPSLLPQNRGRHPLIWAKVLGLKKSGTSFFFMDEGADTGDLLDQKEFEILFEDDAAVLYEKMISNALQQIQSFLPKLQNGTFSKCKQSNLGNIWRKRNAADGLIDFRMTSESICNLVRGLSKPYPGAHCLFMGEEIKIWNVELSISHEENLEPGKVLEVNEANIKVKTFDGAIILTKHEFITIPPLGSYLK